MDNDPIENEANHLMKLGDDDKVTTALISIHFQFQFFSSVSYSVSKVQTELNLINRMLCIE